MGRALKILSKQSPASQRKKLWSIDQSHICSVLGTCFRKSDLRKMARKKQFGLNSEDSDFLLHLALVNQVGARTPTPRALNKMLDNIYKVAIHRYAKVKDDQAIKAFWEEDILSGNIPGAYWAIMTHPSASLELITDIYGQVQMMGHDTLRNYQRDNRAFGNLKEKVALLEKVSGNERQQHFKEKKDLEKKLSDLSEMKQLHISLQAENSKLKTLLDQSSAGESGNLKQQRDELRRHIAYLCGRLDNLSEELEVKENMLKIAEKTVNNLEKTQTGIYFENEKFRQEIMSLEAVLHPQISTTCNCADCEDRDTNRCPGPDLCGRKVLYVGGRQSLVPMYRRLIERQGGSFLHHDGGIEVARARLPEMLTGADAVVCPVDCVSHEACTCVKKVCKRYMKPYVMMRSSGLSSLTKGLAEIFQ
ncbi:DUF2325 domain-containing protein [Desulforhopalus vacuolatus]|uniref:DUF2325 domain-containing protein n=1 Tax=Desulforhopalus vacuolatus TaxID=40414 RepID=UPI00196589C1|nr:DUF2325 domain-containing protein [Desulforhopalus vacuolatus]MBM9520611.1 DUF2325 domain-containing protein [Desulforhopalus vacuolatus]